MVRPPYCGDRLKGNDMTIDAIIVGGFLAMILVPLVCLGWHDCKHGRTVRDMKRGHAKTQPSGSYRVPGGCAHVDAIRLDDADCEECEQPMSWVYRRNLQRNGQDPNVCGMCQCGRLELPSC